MTYVAKENKPIRINTRYNMVDYTDINMVIVKPDKNKIIKDVSYFTLGTSDVPLEGGITLNANEYLLFTPDDTDFDLLGRYELQIEVIGPGGLKLVSLVKTLEATRNIFS